tara:strand:- start:49 stop:786 length:738 start_codon:yes stop_codon:yes gene_type:complete
MNNVFFSKEFDNPNFKNHIIFICDHASNNFPKEFKNLGLNESEINSHIAYDIGAKKITLRLAENLKQSYFISNFSRLLIDLNRNIDDENLIVSKSFGVCIPGNKKISKFEKEKRINFFHEPYHKGLLKIIKKKTKEIKNIFIVSIHSFTKCSLDFDRAIEVGLLWNKNINLLLPLQKKLIEKNIHVGNNFPYSGFHYNYTLDRINDFKTFNNISIEIRNDLICSEKGIRNYVNILSKIFKELLNE